MITSFGAGAPVFQFTLTRSHRPIFIFLRVTCSSVALKYTHLQSRVQQEFTNKHFKPSRTLTGRYQQLFPDFRHG